jgi:hypothetical protein
MARRQCAEMSNRENSSLFEGIKPIYRLGMVLLALFLVILGALDMLSGRTNYYNHWGHVVFAPFLILIGFLLIVAIVFAWARNK